MQPFTAQTLYGAAPAAVPLVTTSREQMVAAQASPAARRTDPNTDGPSGDPVLVFVIVAGLAVLLGYASVAVSVGKK